MNREFDLFGCYQPIDSDLADVNLSILKIFPEAETYLYKSGFSGIYELKCQGEDFDISSSYDESDDIYTSTLSFLNHSKNELLEKIHQFENELIHNEIFYKIELCDENRVTILDLGKTFW